MPGMGRAAGSAALVLVDEATPLAGVRLAQQHAALLQQIQVEHGLRPPLII